MAHVIKCGKRERISYARTTEVIELPDLIEVQTNSYEWFLKEGLREALRKYFLSKITPASFNSSSLATNLVSRNMMFRSVRNVTPVTRLL